MTASAPPQRAGEMPPGRYRSPAGRPRRRNIPLALTGVVLVTGCALAFAAGSVRAGQQRPVLMVTRAIAPGQVFTAADLRVVRVSADPAAQLIPASQQAAVVGRSAAGALAPGSLLTAGGVGAASFPAAGQAEVAVALKPGQFPPDLAPGARVSVLSTPAPPGAVSGAGGGQPVAVAAGQAIVTAVEPAGTTGGDVTVISLQMPTGAVGAVAGAASAGQIALALIPGGG